MAVIPHGSPSLAFLLITGENSLIKNVSKTCTVANFTVSHEHVRALHVKGHPCIRFLLLTERLDAFFWARNQQKYYYGMECISLCFSLLACDLQVFVLIMFKCSQSTSLTSCSVKLLYLDWYERNLITVEYIV